MVKVGGVAASQRGSEQAGAAPPARRLRSSRWRDPRLAVGVVLVAASVVVGARVIAASDDTVAVWSVQRDVTAGTTLTDADVDVERVHFGDADDFDRYFDGDQPIPDDLVADHDLVSGELLARSALVESGTAAVQEVPLPLEAGFYPPDLAAGDRVDVWVAPADDPGAKVATETVLEDAAVLQIDAASAAVGGGASTIALVAVESDDATSVDALLSAVANGSVHLVRVSE